jgi:hypothetical protein
MTVCVHAEVAIVRFATAVSSINISSYFSIHFVKAQLIVAGISHNSDFKRLIVLEYKTVLPDRSLERLFPVGRASITKTLGPGGVRYPSIRWRFHVNWYVHGVSGGSADATRSVAGKLLNHYLLEPP